MLPTKQTTATNEQAAPSALMDVVCRLTGQCFYIIDFSYQHFLYTADHPLLLCGYSIDELSAISGSFFRNVLPKADYERMNEVIGQSIQLFTRLSKEEQMGAFLSFEHRLKNKMGFTVAVQHTISPVVFEQDTLNFVGKLAIIPNGHLSNETFLRIPALGSLIPYNHKAHRFHSPVTVTLTPCEHKILERLGRHHSTVEIANSLHITENTVKHHKKNLFKKLNAKTSMEAVLHAWMYGVLKCVGFVGCIGQAAEDFIGMAPIPFFCLG